MTRASVGVGPTTNSAGPAVESHVDGSGLATTALSGGGTVGTAVSFFPAAGVLRSHASVSASIRTGIDSLTTRRVHRGSRCISRNLHGLLAPSIETDSVRPATSPDVFDRRAGLCAVPVTASVIHSRGVSPGVRDHAQCLTQLGQVRAHEPPGTRPSRTPRLGNVRLGGFGLSLIHIS